MEPVVLSLGRMVEVLYGFVGGLLGAIVTAFLQLRQGDLPGLHVAIKLLIGTIAVLFVMWLTREIFGGS